MELTHPVAFWRPDKLFCLMKFELQAYSLPPPSLDTISSELPMSLHINNVEIITYLLTYLFTPCSRVLLEKLTGSQPVKKFLVLY